MLGWMIALASLFATPTLLPWRGRYAYALALPLLVVGLIAYGLHEMAQPGYHGSAGDDFSLGILLLFLGLLCMALCLGLLLRGVAAWWWRRRRRQ